MRAIAENPKRAQPTAMLQPIEASPGYRMNVLIRRRAHVSRDELL